MKARGAGSRIRPYTLPREPTCTHAPRVCTPTYTGRPRVDATDNMQLRAVSSTLSCSHPMRAARYLPWNACGMRGENGESMLSMPITKCYRHYPRRALCNVDQRQRSGPASGRSSHRRASSACRAISLLLTDRSPDRREIISNSREHLAMCSSEKFHSRNRRMNSNRCFGPSN